MRLKTIKQIKEYVERESNCKFLSTKRTYEKNEKYLFKCSCGNKFETSISNFRKGQRQCISCGKSLRNKSTRFTIEQVREYVYLNSDCELLSNEYVNANTKIKFRCSCGNEFEKTFASFKDSSRKTCRKCYDLSVKDRYYLSFDKVNEYIKSVSKCNLLDIYTFNNMKFIKLECECGEKYDTRFSWFKQGGTRRCKKCTGAISIFEYEAMEILDSMGIEYETQKTFDDLKYKNVLKFDLYIPSLNIVIELDGVQHYEPIVFFGGEVTYEKIKQRDKIKDEYCLKNNIKMIRIPYKDKNKLKLIIEKSLR